MWGLAPSEFWRMSPQEFWAIVDARAPTPRVGPFTVTEFNELRAALDAPPRKKNG